MSERERPTGGTVDDPRLITPALLREWPLPSPEGGKDSRGAALVVGGDRKTPGAAMLAGLAALRVGAGRLTLAVGADIASEVAVAIPESGVLELAEDESGALTGEDAADVLKHEAERADVVLVGPGLHNPEGALRLVSVAADCTGTPVVLDAFGITVLPDAREQVRTALAGRLVLTPNSTELGWLLERDVDSDGTAQAVLDVARRYDAVVSCSGWVGADGELFQVTTGDSGLGTSGSGDVLAGAVLGLLCRGAELITATAWATYIHAGAGDLLTTEVGRVGYLARELVPGLPRMLVSLGGIR